MVRKLVAVGALLATLAGCTKPDGGACTEDAQCGEGGKCDLSVQLCYAAGTEPELDGGACMPACAAYQACTTGGCKPRFSRLEFLSPATNALLDGGPVEVSVQLVANAFTAPPYPDTLVFSAAPSGGGAGGTFTGQVRNGDTYTVTWAPPAVQGPVTLTAAHPVAEAVASASRGVQVDAVAPTFTIAFSTPLPRAVGSTTQAEQKDPEPGYEAAFRRDEPVTVTVSANEAVSNVTLKVMGIAAGGGVGAAMAPVAVQPGGTCGGSPVFCGSAVVDLSKPEMQVFRGTMRFQVEGVDEVGHPGAALAQRLVTRWKWMFEAGSAISGTPAVGHAHGFVYGGTNLSNGTGRMFALGPDGALKGEAPSVGDVSGSPSVGDVVSGEETVYFAAKNGSGSALYAYMFSASSVVEKIRCGYSNASDLAGSIALGTTSWTDGSGETGIGIYGGNPVRIVGVRPGAPAAERCFEISGVGQAAIPTAIPGSALVFKGQNIFYGATASRITSYDIATGSNTPRADWPKGTNSFTRGLAWVGGQLYGAAGNSDDPGLGSLFASPTASGAISLIYPQTNTSRVFNLSVGSGNIAYFGAETASSAELLSVLLTSSGATPTRAGSVGTLRGAPVVGKNGRLYTLNSGGKVAEWASSTLAPLWSIDLQQDLSMKDSSPTLDCQRAADGTVVAGASVGTLYFAAGTKLYAFVVDSPGMDPNAPWPKFQHDARNTGNPDTPVTNCP